MSSHSALPPEVFAQVTQAWALQDYGWGEELLTEACRRYPFHQHLRTCHAAALGYCGRYTSARSAFQVLLDEAPPHRKLHMHALLGIEWCRIGRHDLAVPLLRAALEDTCPVAPVFQSLADAQLRLRQATEALVTLEVGLAQHPGNPGLLLLKARALRLGGDPERAFATGQQVIDNPNTSPETKAEAWHELGHALDALQRYRDAFSAFHSAKLCLRSQAATFLPLWVKQNQAMRRLEDQPSRADYLRWKDTLSTLPPLDGRLVFLTGIPRSGTTLLERVLDAHSTITSASETPIFGNMWNRLLRRCSGNRRLGESLSSLAQQDLHEGRTRYWSEIGEAIECATIGRFVLDKNPSSMPNVPAIRRFFPESKLLVAMRDPRAVAWSCFTQYLPLNPETSAFNSFETLGTHIATVHRFWLQARNQLPAGTWRECRYETLVGDFEAEARRTLDFLDLPWDEGVSSHHSNPAPVRSPTYAQASQPIYSRAVENWRHYEEFMGDTLAALKEVIEELGYQ